MVDWSSGRCSATKGSVFGTSLRGTLALRVAVAIGWLYILGLLDWLSVLIVNLKGDGCGTGARHGCEEGRGEGGDERDSHG